MAYNSTDPLPLSIGDDKVEHTGHVRYLGSLLSATGDIDCDVKARISAAWAKWREVAGVTCNPKMPVKLKWQVYKTIIRPLLLYGSETWLLLDHHKQELRVTEMKMLRWMCGVSLRGCMRSSRIRGSLHVRDIADKLQESRSRWYGHVLRKPAAYIGNRCLAMPPPPGPGEKGRPKMRWLDIVRYDMRAHKINRKGAEDRAKWRRHCRKADPGSSRVSAEYNWD